MKCFRLHYPLHYSVRSREHCQLSFLVRCWHTGGQAGRGRNRIIDLHEGNATGVVSAIDLLPEVYALECLTLLS